VDNSAVPGGIPELTFRRGQADDWPAILPIVAETWEGHDYIDEQLWRFWVEDQKGALIVATLDERVTAFGKLTRLGSAEWWMEGLRVDPAYRQKGIARAVHHYMIQVFWEIGDGMLRFATASVNEATHRLAAQTNFRHIMSYRPMVTPTIPGEDISNMRRLRAPNLEMVARYLANSPMNRVNRYVEHHWTLFYLTTERLRHYLGGEEIEITGWRLQDGQLGGIAVIMPEQSETRPFGREDPDDPRRLRVGYLDAVDDTTLTQMGIGLRGLAAARGFEQVAWKMPVAVGLERLAPILGFEPEHDVDLWLFELPLNP
jgi:GNAT superfamily N-acetyltransferase